MRRFCHINSESDLWEKALQHLLKDDIHKGETSLEIKHTEANIIGEPEVMRVSE